MLVERVDTCVLSFDHNFKGDESLNEIRLIDSKTRYRLKKVISTISLSHRKVSSGPRSVVNSEKRNIITKPFV